MGWGSCQEDNLDANEERLRRQKLSKRKQKTVEVSSATEQNPPATPTRKEKQRWRQRRKKQRWKQRRA